MNQLDQAREEVSRAITAAPLESYHWEAFTDLAAVIEIAVLPEPEGQAATQPLRDLSAAQKHEEAYRLASEEIAALIDRWQNLSTATIQQASQGLEDLRPGWEAIGFAVAVRGLRQELLAREV